MAQMKIRGNWNAWMPLACIGLLSMPLTSNCFLLAQTPATPQPAGRSRAVDAMQQPEAKRGQQQFSQTCSFCHGADANGGAEGPSLVLSSLVRHDKHGELIGQV